MKTRKLQRYLNIKRTDSSHIIFKVPQRTHSPRVLSDPFVDLNNRGLHQGKLTLSKRYLRPVKITNSKVKPLKKYLPQLKHPTVHDLSDTLESSVKNDPLEVSFGDADASRDNNLKFLV